MMTVTWGLPRHRRKLGGHRASRRYILQDMQRPASHAERAAVAARLSVLADCFSGYKAEHTSGDAFFD
jgi:hypothetical protein